MIEDDWKLEKCQQINIILKKVLELQERVKRLEK